MQTAAVTSDFHKTFLFKYLHKDHSISESSFLEVEKFFIGNRTCGEPGGVDKAKGFF